MVLCVDLVVVIVRVPVAAELLCVHAREQVGDKDMLGAAVRAVAACGAGDGVGRAYNVADLRYRPSLLVAQGLKVLHKRQVVVHLRHVAHAGEHHEYAVEIRCVAYRVARRAAAVKSVEYSLALLGNVGEFSALDRLHDYYGLVMLAADFVAEARLNGGIVEVDIVELDLNHLNLRVFVKHLVEYIGGVVEREAYVLYLALFFQLERVLIGVQLLVFFK